jgi:hypothetical protein
MPKELNQGVLYISMEYSLIMHLCACGCGEKVATPLSPEDWKLYYDGESVSLSPSIGNWDFPCESHYWIRKNKVMFIGSSKEQNIENKSIKKTKLYQSMFTTIKKIQIPSKKKTKKKRK